MVKYLLIALAFVGVHTAHAQISNPLQISVVPKYVQPNSTISVSVEAYSIDLNSATISWSVDGVPYSGSAGNTHIAVPVGDVGESVVVTVGAQTPQGQRFDLRRVITPAEAAIVWEADTYTPPLYKGRSLFTSQSTLHFVAIPNIVRNGSRVPNSQLVFTWEHDGTILGSKSGTGQDSLTLTGSILSQPEVVAVEVKTLDGAISTRERIVVPIIGSRVRIYEDTPLLGTRFERALGATEIVTNQEITLRAYPYFMPVTDPRSLVWDWIVGDIHTYDQQITLRNTTQATSGRVPIELNVEKVGSLLHTRTTDIDLIFE